MEDNSADVGLVREALQDHGVTGELIVIDNGEGAEEFIASLEAEGARCPDLVILDLNLPRKPGREVLAKMRRSAKCGHIPVVILTSSEGQRDRDDAARLGASQYIRKPVRLAEFLQLGSVFKAMLSGS